MELLVTAHHVGCFPARPAPVQARKEVQAEQQHHHKSREHAQDGRRRAVVNGDERYDLLPVSYGYGSKHAIPFGGVDVIEHLYAGHSDKLNGTKVMTHAHLCLSRTWGFTHSSF